MALILNQSFKAWAVSKKYPFTNDSDHTSTDGRRIPLSFVIDAFVYPAVDGVYSVRRIDGEGITIGSNNTDYATAAFSDYARGWIPFKREGSVVGSIVLNEDDYPYVVGLANIQSMTFRSGHLDFESGVVHAFCTDKDNITTKPTFFGQEVDTITVTYASPRYTIVSDNIVDMSLDDLTVTTTHVPVSKITVNGVSYDIHPTGNLTLRAPDWCDTQFITQGEGVVLHRRGV